MENKKDKVKVSLDPGAVIVQNCGFCGKEVKTNKWCSTFPVCDECKKSRIMYADNEDWKELPPLPEEEKLPEKAETRTEEEERELIKQQLKNEGKEFEPGIVIPENSGPGSQTIANEEIIYRAYCTQCGEKFKTDKLIYKPVCMKCKENKTKTAENEPITKGTSLTITKLQYALGISYDEAEDFFVSTMVNFYNQQQGIIKAALEEQKPKERVGLGTGYDRYPDTEKPDNPPKPNIPLYGALKGKKKIVLSKIDPNEIGV